MSDTDNTSEGTQGTEGRKLKAGYDPFDRQVVDPNDPRFVEANRNRENVEDFGFISQELATDELETPEPEPEPEKDDA